MSVLSKRQNFHNYLVLYSRNALSAISAYDSEKSSDDCLFEAAETKEVESSYLEAECALFVFAFKKEICLISVNDTLNFVHMSDLNHSYANLAIARRVLLNVPIIAVATSERSFRKLKFMKTFNRSTMTDDRLSSLIWMTPSIPLPLAKLDKKV